MYNRISAGILLTTLIVTGAGASGGDANEEKAEVTKTIMNSIKWCFPDKSRERLYGSVVNDSTFFMFQPNSRATIDGFKAFRQFSERVFMVDECTPQGSTIKNLRVILSRSDNVAWFSCLLDDWGEWAGEPWNWKDTRWTGVLKKTDGKWVMMQQHFSMAEDAVRAEVMEEIKPADSQNEDNITIGETVKFQSTVLQKEIQLSVHVPDNPNDEVRRYPVLYTFQTHFKQVAGAVKNLYDYSLTPEMLVVRIDNYEFGYLTPTTIASNPNSGQADVFLEFFEKELFPFIDSTYPTHPYRIVFSNSWGALFVTYAMLSKPAVFNAGIASIPWIMYDGEDRFILKNVQKYLETKKYKNFLYMTMDDELDMLPDLPLFVEILRENPMPGLDWEYHHWPEEDHTSTPYRSIFSGLRALYALWSRIPEEVSIEGVEAIKRYELTLNVRFGYNIGISGMALRLAGQSLQKRSMHKSAIAVYEYAVEKDPENLFAYVALGKALEANDQLERAKETFEAAVRIAELTSAPQIKWIRNFLDILNEKIEARYR